MDNVTLSRIAKLHPKLRSEVVDIITILNKLEIEIRIVQGLRTFDEQNTLYTQGRTTPGAIVTQAKGGESYHNFGLALDFCLLHKDDSISFNLTEDMNQDHKSDFQQVIDTFKSKGWISGADWKFKDTDHVEKTFGFNFNQLLLLPKDKDGYVLF